MERLQSKPNIEDILKVHSMNYPKYECEYDGSNKVRVTEWFNTIDSELYVIDVENDILPLKVVDDVYKCYLYKRLDDDTYYDLNSHFFNFDSDETQGIETIGFPVQVINAALNAIYVYRRLLGEKCKYCPTTENLEYKIIPTKQDSNQKDVYGVFCPDCYEAVKKESLS
jgi:hypothetical protein